MSQAKYTLCAHLPQWPIDRLRRRRPALRHRPFVLVDSVGERQIVSRASPDVRAPIRIGMTLGEARSYCADLLHLPAAQEDDGRALVALGRWLVRFSPAVSPCPPDAIFLDVTGMERLYGGPAVVLRLVADALAALHVTARLAVAPTPGGAWALATYGTAAAPAHVAGDRDALLRAVAPLPPAALRLEHDVTAALRALGINTVGSLLQLPREGLMARFGPAVLRRIDQMTGDLIEPLAPLEHRTPIGAAIDFDGAVEGLDAIHTAVRHLLGDVTAELARRGQGARELRLTLPRPYAPAVERTIHLARPSRSINGLFELIRCALEGMQADDRSGVDGFLGARLDVARPERLTEEQATLLGDEEQRAAAALAHLVERLEARFDACLQWPVLVESRMPERAVACGPAPAAVGGPAPRYGVRPTRLLRVPEELRVTVMPSESLDGLPVAMTRRSRVHRLSRARGPERIAGEWWDGRGGKTRDYYDAEDEAGRRYWLFRVLESGRWFLHGMFE